MERCGNGHELTDQNVYVDDGRRRCRECRKERDARAYQKRRAKLDTERNCSVQGCERGGVLTRGYCSTHYQRLRRFGSTDDPKPKDVAICSVEDCDRPVRRKDLCDLHAQRAKRHGDPLVVQRIMGDDRARFLSHVDQDGPIPDRRPDLGPCWIWTGVRHKTRGYGRFGVGGRAGRHVQAHRWSYEFSVGPIPEGLEIDHLCRVTPCVNPTHLEPVTSEENKRRTRSDYGMNTS